MRDLAAAWTLSSRTENTASARRNVEMNLGALATMPVHTVDTAVLRDWADVLLTGRPWADQTPLSPRTVSNLVAQVGGILRRAADDGIITAVPRMPTVKTGRPKVTRDTLPTVEQVWSMIDANNEGGNGIRAHPQFARMILTAAGSGLRATELCLLRIGSVDLGRRELHVVRGLKTSSSRRTVPIGRLVANVLETEIGGRGNPAAPIFTTARGNLWTRSGIANRMIVTRKAAKVPDHITFHSFRHFYVSMLIADGRSPTTVAAYIGHRSASFTLDTYSHLWEGESGRVRDAVDAGLARDGGGVPGAPPDVDPGDGHVIGHVPEVGADGSTCGD